MKVLGDRACEVEEQIAGFATKDENMTFARRADENVVGLVAIHIAGIGQRRAERRASFCSALIRMIQGANEASSLSAEEVN